MADPANRITQEVGEQTEFAAGANLASILHLFNAESISVWIKLSHPHHSFHIVLHIHNHFNRKKRKLATVRLSTQGLEKGFI